jgi:pyrroline-5-carboxylate reductase
MNIYFIGGGNMARAIIGGLKRNGVNSITITVLEPDADKRHGLSQEFGINTTDNYDTFHQANVVVFAVKPQQLREVCAVLQPHLQQQLLVSIAAGVRSKDIARWLLGYQSIVRVMPNTPAQIGAGISALYALPAVSAEQRQQASAIMEAVGKVL